MGPVTRRLETCGEPHQQNPKPICTLSLATVNTVLLPKSSDERRIARMTLGLLSAIGRTFRRKRASSLDILSPKRAPRTFYKGKNCKSTGFNTKKGGYVVQQDKLPNYVIPDLTGFKLKPYVSQCPVEVNKTTGSAEASK
ncbi:hypothetical protein HA466_0220080 [Hirschfeldia incana]|nr:hypothetical protein HA466_0220080 [Hirschfeldia incana]